MEEENSFHNNVIHAAKWSSVTEIGAKLISPITNMILARIIAPEAFGIVATVTMVISFADMFTDSGFHKYLVQHEFFDEDEKYKNANVAFWTNLSISVFLWVIIIIFRNQLAALVGNPWLGDVLAIASLQLPLTSFSSIQMALYRRDFDFKTLFIARMVSVCIPFAITIPLAILGLKYWALIIGSITIQLSNAVVLTAKSKWKPKFYFDIKVLKEMLSFSIWSLIEAVSIWLTTWIDSFIIGSVLNQYYLGIYKTSISMVNTLMALITGAVAPVLFSALSRLQNYDNQFAEMFFKFQRLVSILVLPLGVGVYLYRDLVTGILLGKQWVEAVDIVGIWALISSIQIVLSQFCSEAYRAKGKPKLSLLAQILHLVVLVPVCIISSKYGFWVLVYSRSLIRLEGVMVGLILMKLKLGFSVIKIFKNVSITAFAAALMGMFGIFINRINDDIVWKIVSIFFCIFVYFGILFVFPKMRQEIINIFSGLIKNKKNIENEK